MKALLKILCSISICLAVSAYALPPFSKVIFFGDSLSDIGNNQIDATGKAPDTNQVPDGNGHYRPGDVWAVPFVKNLKAHGLLTADATTTVIPSYYFDQNISVNPNDSLDFAYSGDPTGGYIIEGNHFVSQRHMRLFPNGWCVDQGKNDPPIEPNELCGMENRILNFVTHTTPFKMVDPNALYVLWAGPNDIEQKLAPTLNEQIRDGNIIDPNAKNQAAIDTIQTAVMNIRLSVAKLSEQGARYFMVINLPNLGWTPQGYLANKTYNDDPRHPNAPKNVINQLFTNLTNGFNGALKTALDGAEQDYHVTIIQPDLNTLFKITRAGYKDANGNTQYLPAFPASAINQVNASPTTQWFDTCCKPQSNYNYDPTQCKTSAQNPMCDGPNPRLSASKGRGNYVFFNDIHPTTCAHKYIAAWFESYIPGGQSFDVVRDKDLCD